MVAIGKKLTVNGDIMPPDACGEYDGPQGRTWIKGLDTSRPGYPMAYVWSLSPHPRWRTVRERINLDGVKLYPPRKPAVDCGGLAI